MHDVRRLIVLDSGLRAERGHHGNFNRLVHREAIARGWQISIFAHRRLCASLEAELAATPHFSNSPYDRRSRDERFADIDNYVELNLAYEQDLNRLDLDDREGDLILVPTITHNQLLGLARWLRSDTAPQSARVAVVLLFTPGWEVLGTSTEIARSLYHHALQQLAAVEPHRLVFCAETEPVAREYETLTDRPVHVIAWPTVEPEVLSRVNERAATETQQSSSPLIGYFGYAKAERGIELLPDIVNGVLRDHDSARFLIQLDTYSPDEIQHATDALQALAPRVQIHHGSMQRTALLDAMAATNLMLLPYDPAPYAQRGSALFSEAAMLGIPTVLPSKTWMASEQHAWQLGGVPFDTFTSDSIANATLSALENLENLRAASLAAAPRWAEQRTAGAFLNQLCSLLPAPPAVV